MNIGVIQETREGENRVALVPRDVKELKEGLKKEGLKTEGLKTEGLKKEGIGVMIERGAGEKAGYMDEDYELNGGVVLGNSQEVFEKCECIVHVNPFSKRERGLMREGQVVISFLDGLTDVESVKELKEGGVTSLGMELIPRTTRAQGMDALSSMANIAGYKSVLMGAYHFSKIVPMMTTAAGTMSAARFLILGVGVAGLQAIATAKRLGGIVYAYDVRRGVKEQVESLGGNFVDMEIEEGEGGAVEGEGGYARGMDELFYQKQRELMVQVLKKSDIVITTALIPGKKSPILITQKMVQSMKNSSIIIDLAAERGGNCEITKYGKTIRECNITIIGPKDLSSTVPFHSSQMYSKNISNLLKLIVKNQQFHFQDPIIQEIMITQNKKIIHQKILKIANSSS